VAQFSKASYGSQDPIVGAYSYGWHGSPVRATALGMALLADLDTGAQRISKGWLVPALDFTALGCSKGPWGRKFATKLSPVNWVRFQIHFYHSFIIYNKSFAGKIWCQAFWPIPSSPLFFRRLLRPPTRRWQSLLGIVWCHGTCGFESAWTRPKSTNGRLAIPFYGARLIEGTFFARNTRKDHGFHHPIIGHIGDFPFNIQYRTVNYHYFSRISLFYLLEVTTVQRVLRKWDETCLWASKFWWLRAGRLWKCWPTIPEWYLGSEIGQVSQTSCFKQGKLGT
jgi:hypothetical protein